MKASDVMSAPVHVISPSETVAHARNLMVRHRISRLLVMEDGMLSGIITKKDLAYRLRQSEPAWRRRPIDRIPVSVLAVPDPITVRPDTGIREIARILVNNNISSVPVTDGDAVIGIVTKSDLMKSAMINSFTCPVADMMEDVATVSRYHSLDHVIDVMSERNDKVVVTNNDESIAGIITETNLAFFDNEQKIAGVVERGVPVRRRKQPRGTRGAGTLFLAPVIAQDIMTSPVITASLDTPVNRAVSSMNRHQINSLVIVDKNDIAGIIKRDDIIREVAK
ncbi:MAG: CBS domain-containing protein [Methanoregula sp.]|nr:MAG: CBS domain-containing protein [Methanoregula sp.]